MLKEGESLYMTTSLKKLLNLFEDDALMEKLELGDTWHPFSGYIDAAMLFTKAPTVKEFLRHDYDWRGLVAFSCTIGSLKISITGKTAISTKYTFGIDGPYKTLLKLERLLIEKNAYEPGVYKLNQ